jgi:xylulose-5-phosphate/fructose-6-phosphate phosphoketolase
MVAVFDTAFHREMPERARRYALPAELAERHGIRRYGFHGIAHASMLDGYLHASGRLRSEARVITLQLGNGCSAAAISHGRSIDTSMGFTPLEGLVMGTRSGDLDPSVVGYLCEKEGAEPADVERWLNEASGLLGVSGRSNDMRDLLAAVTQQQHQPSMLAMMDAYWRAANYLSVGQIYLYDNPLLKEPLRLEHVKPRLLGHWGTTPGLNFVYVHLNRIIRQFDLNVINVTGPGHGGPALVANTYLEGTYSEFYPNISQDEQGMKRLFTQFSFPGGIPSHVAPETPGSINEGGELGYALSHAYGAAFDNPDLLVACVVGDGEAETGPLATSWHSNKFLNPARDGAVLPILHLNGYKIAGPTVLARIPHDELERCSAAMAIRRISSRATTPSDAPADGRHARYRGARSSASSATRAPKDFERPRWPMIILRSPKGWTGPETVDGKPIEGTFRAHQVPVTNFVKQPEHVQILEQWMKSYRPEELFDDQGRLMPELAELAPPGESRMGANPHANGGMLLRDLKMPDFRDYAVEVPKPGEVRPKRRARRVSSCAT